uniref:protein-tyrosine-phosphatase n=1 Tax=Periophthalmus magnuspinnatus TaxID=409849 RepID=A0A3B4AGQ2_9GOBI
MCQREQILTLENCKKFYGILQPRGNCDTWACLGIQCQIRIKDFNVFRLIQEMRTQRHSAVQTKVCFLRVDESSPDKSRQQSDEDRWDTPPPKPPRIRSAQTEGDVKEEILQPPEPHPVPPILTPSPPSAFPTVTDVRQDNDRYHPKPVLHILATAHNNTTQVHKNFFKLFTVVDVSQRGVQGPWRHTSTSPGST